MTPRTLWIAGLAVTVTAALWLAPYRSKDASGVDEPPQPAAESPASGQADSSRAVGEAAVPSLAVNEAEQVRRSTTAMSAAADVAASSLRSWLDAREVMLPPGADLRIGELAAEPRDRAWSAGMEERLISQIARWDVTLADWYTECRTSRCIVALLYPASSESPVLEAPARPTLPKAHTELMHATNLIGNAIWRVPAADGTIVYLHHFHRRCGPDWKCLE